MDKLPLELLRLIFQNCDLTSIKSLRAVCGYFADVGLEYLIPPQFVGLSWREDLDRLQSIARHDHLKDSIESVTWNFNQPHMYNARHASYLNHYHLDAEERTNLLNEAWQKCLDAEKTRGTVADFEGRGCQLIDAFKRLPNLKQLFVTFNESHIDHPMFHDLLRIPKTRKMNHARACKKVNVFVSAMQYARISSFTIDRLPLEIFRGPDDRRHWSACRTAFSNLSKLDLTIDWTNVVLPQAKVRAVNGLGHALHFSPNVTHLSITFQNYNQPCAKFVMFFKELLDGLTFENLTDLKLDGFACDEDDLKEFLVRHAGTLRRLRLGGRGLSNAWEPSDGGITLFRGSFRSLFRSLHQKLSVLERVHLEGRFECGMQNTARHEVHTFHAITDDDWKAVQYRKLKETIGCEKFEAYIVQGGQYPVTDAHINEQPA